MTGEEVATSPAGGDYRCPIPDTHDKFEEAHYFLHQTVNNFHEPEMFRWNLNAFLQALKAVTGVLRTEASRREGWKEWWKAWEAKLHGDPLLERFTRGRDLLVHQRRLAHRSTADLGIFRYGRLKFAIGLPIPVEMSSAAALERFARMDEGLFRPDHESGEEYGIKRRWLLDDLTDETDDLVITCHRAWTHVGELVSAAHDWLGATLPVHAEDDPAHLPDQYDVLLESQL